MDQSETGYSHDSIGRLRTISCLATFLLLLSGLASCSSGESDQLDELADASTLYDEPEAFAAILYPADNPTTKAGLELGRRLFYDPILSADSTISCASCHRPELAFTDGKRISVGIAGRLGKRNAPGLTNIGYNHKSLFWDGRSPNLEEQALHPIADPREMGGNWPRIFHKIRRHDYYRDALIAAFDLDGAYDLNPDHVGMALAQYQRSLISGDSRYDRWLRRELDLNASEQRGWAIFFDLADDEAGEFAGLPVAECAHCHSAPHFSNQQFFNNGLDEAVALSDFVDPGRGGVSKQESQLGQFRVPSLRNVALTAPYMHDGRFLTLQEVVAHYNAGGHYAPNRSPNVRPLGLNERDQRDLVAFLQTLTDTTFVNRELAIARQYGYQFSEP